MEWAGFFLLFVVVVVMVVVVVVVVVVLIPVHQAVSLIGLVKISDKRRISIQQVVETFSNQLTTVF